MLDEKPTYSQPIKGFNSSRLAQVLGGMDDPNYRLSVLQIDGSAIYDSLVIVSSEPHLIDEEEGGAIAGRRGEPLYPPSVAVGKALQRIRMTPGVEDTLVYVCGENLDYYKYEKMMDSSKLRFR